MYKKTGVMYLFILLGCLLNTFAGAFGDFSRESTLTIAQRQLNIDKASAVLIRKQFSDLKITKDQQFGTLQEKGVSKNSLKQAQLDYIAAKAAIEGVNIALTDAIGAVSENDDSIHSLEKNLQDLILLPRNNKDSEAKIISVEANLEFLKRLKQIQHERVLTLNEMKAMTQERLLIEKQWQQKLQTLYAAQQQDQRRNRLSSLLYGLQQQQQSWLIQLSHLTQDLQSYTEQDFTDASLKKLHLKILEAEENVALIRLKSYLVHLQNRLENLQAMAKTPKSSAGLSGLLAASSNILTQLESSKEFVIEKKNFLSMKEKELVFDLDKKILSPQDASSYSVMLHNILNLYDLETVHIGQLEQKTADYQHEIKIQLQHHLSERQKFPSDWPGWISLGQKLLQIPYLLLHSFHHFIQQCMVKFNGLTAVSFNFALLLLGVLLGGWFYLRRFLLNLEINIKENKRFSTNVIFIIIELIRRNIGSALIFSLLLALTLSIESASLLFICLAIVYLCFKVSLSLAKLTLLENTHDISGKGVKIYQRIRWILLLGFVLSAMTMIAAKMPIAYEAKICVNRLFMVFILMIAIEIFKVRTVFPDLLGSIIYIPRRYFYRILQSLSLLIPLVLAFNAVVGLMGYVELAWAIAKYQGIFILALVGYLLIRGLLIDAMEYLSEILIRHIKQGWLWTEAILKPLDKILRIILFIFSAIFLAHLFHLDNNEVFVSSAKEMVHQKLFSIGGNNITVLLLCELLISISLIKWLARWSREFSYRWLYANAKDVGVRNSLSIFTQYASVIIAVLIGLKFLGIDLKGFAIVAAAFAAGIGFGMRDLIVNFFSGILLLIERPFRNGDIITLGAYEGEVILTGMRSMTIRTWDHMEVIVPNADMFTKPFMNWTHHDNIVRTVITLKIHRDDDPHKVQNLILHLLRHHPSVAKEPFPEVIMSELSEALIEMQVRYYVLLSSQRTRAGVRSEVLFAIWDCFKENNIQSPNPQYDLIVKNQPSPIFAEI